MFRLFSGLCVQDTDIRVFLRIAEADGHDLVMLYDDVHDAAFAYADIDRAFRRDGWDGVQDLQRRTAEGAVDRGGCDHVSQLLQGSERGDIADNLKHNYFVLLQVLL